MRHFIPIFVFLILITLNSCSQQPTKNDVSLSKPNFLLIAIDDLNDWIGVLGGHPQAITPNIDRLASQGMLFTNAHCQAPVCNPSRASMMISRYPSSTGIYFLNPDIAASEEAKRGLTMPERFQREGYYVTGAGKIFHNAGGLNEKYIPNYGGSFGGFGPLPEKKISSFPGLRLWDWGIFPESDTLMPDHQIAAWAVEQLKIKRDSAWWMGIGFYRPHVPQFAPQKWFDLYPLENIKLPDYLETDLQDVPSYGNYITRLKHIAPTLDWVKENDAWKPLVQSYLACVSFVDDQIGKVIQALEDSDDADNTYIILYSDHGFHLGEKDRFAKRSLWSESTKVPLIIVGPGIEKGAISNQPVQLLDIYPTLLELAGFSPDSLHEGHSLLPVLQDKKNSWPHFARTSFGPGNYAIVSEKYRYIQYNDGSSEFYDHRTDPHEWNNLIDSEEHQDLIQQHQQFIPKSFRPILGEGSTGHQSFYATQALLEQGN